MLSFKAKAYTRPKTSRPLFIITFISRKPIFKSIDVGASIAYRQDKKNIPYRSNEIWVSNLKKSHR